MFAYELYTFNQKKGYEFIGVLPERRRNPTRITKDSVMNWGRMLLGDNMDSKNMFFKQVAIDNLSGRILWVDLPFNNKRVIRDRRSLPTSFISILKFGGRRKSFRRIGEGRNQYVDRLSFRTIVLAFTIFTLSTLDVIFTIGHLKYGGSELNPLMAQIIQSGFQYAFIIKSPCTGLIVCFLASHQNFKISFYGMHALATIYIALTGYHLMCSYLFWAT
jgi:hypothetical protein